ncbi:MAG: aquaporin [Gemmatimonadota bacterium]
MDRWKPALAEALGTFALTFFGAGAIIMDVHTDGGVGLLGVAFAHGIVLAVMVTATLHVSGGHINPAVSLAAWATKLIDAKTALRYIIFQVVGAIAAAGVLVSLYPEAAVSAAAVGTPALSGDVTVAQGVLIEAILTFFLVFAVFGTAVDSRAPKVGGFAIGLVLVFDILAGGPLTGAAMNPARAFGPAVASGQWANHAVYWAGPIIGGLAAGTVYTRLFMPNGTTD